MGQVLRLASVALCILMAAPLSEGRADSGAAAVPSGALAVPENAEPQAPPGSRIFIPTFKPSDFRFGPFVSDDGKDPAGGWQEARAKLEFKKVTIPTGIARWSCPITIQIPIRHSSRGYISPDTAATISAGVTNSVAAIMDFDLPQGIFCDKFIVGVRAAFRSMHPDLGARVSR